MEMETLPAWFWGAYYLFLLTTLSLTIYCILKNRIKKLSIANLLIIISSDPMWFIQSIGRMEGTEFDYLMSQLAEGALWPIYVLFGFLFMVIWWVFFLISFITRSSPKKAAY
jgi:hypothetical protein